MFHILIGLFNQEDEDSDDEDDTAELLAELQKIKKERASEKAKMVFQSYTLAEVVLHPPPSLLQYFLSLP